MLENCDALLNATAVYHQNHDYATRNALGKVSQVSDIGVGVYIRMAPPTHDQLQTQRGSRLTQRGGATQSPPPSLRVADSGASENLAIWRIWRLIWHRLDKYSINYVAHWHLGEKGTQLEDKWIFYLGYSLFRMFSDSPEGYISFSKCGTFYWLDLVLNRC